MMLRALGLGALLTLTAAAAPAAPTTATLHFDLAKSTPAADATVHAVPEVRLWFTAVPQDKATSIRVVNAAGEAVSTGDVVQDATDGKVFSIALPNALGAGAYKVVWRSMGDDGHVVRGDFAFSVMAH